MAVSTLSFRCLLLVEDDRWVRETIMLMLEDDFEIRVAVSVSSALALLQALDLPPIDVMLVDCMLPDGNVGELLSEADRRSIPLVLISGDPNEAEKLDPTRVFLPKPFTRAALLSALDTARR